MIDLHNYEVWIAAGSQRLYGRETFQRVEQHARSGVDARAPDCVGVAAWMHPFSPAMDRLSLYLQTQYNRDFPWRDIETDFMNLNQSALGDREFGFINARMRRPRKVAAGQWQDAHFRQRPYTGRRGAPYWFQPIARTGIPGGCRINN